MAIAPLPIEALLATRTLWHAGRSAAIAHDGEPTGFDALDALLPQRGWPRRALTELLLPADGVGELSLLLPTLARLTQAGGTAALVAPPYVPYAPAWQAAGVELSQLQVINASPRDALWTFEQCLRSGACAAVLGWPATGDAQALRRLQVAADSGDCLGFVLRDGRHGRNPSPAALRLEAVHDARDGIAWQVRKCRGGPLPSRAFKLPEAANARAFEPKSILATRGSPLRHAGAERAQASAENGSPAENARTEANRRLPRPEPLSRARAPGGGENRARRKDSHAASVVSLFPFPDAQPASRASSSRGHCPPERGNGLPRSR